MKYLFNKFFKYKLALSFLLNIVLFIVVGAITFNGLYTLGNFTKTIYEHPLVVSNSSLIAALNITKIHRSMKDVVLANSPAEIDDSLKRVAKFEKIVYQQLDIIRLDILGSEGKLLEKQTRKLLIKWKPIRKEVVQLIRTGNKYKAIHITMYRGANHVRKLEVKMLELTSYARNKATMFMKLAEAKQAKLEIITICLIVAGIILSVLIALFAIYREIKVEKRLIDEKNKLQNALVEIKTLRGIIPICSHCKQIRDDQGFWKQIEVYIHAHSEAEFSHSVCPNCVKKYYPEEYVKINQDKNKEK